MAIDPVETVKSVGAGLAGCAGLAYACGYLALRARARALGTDPSFDLVSEAYVYAGFRFALQTGILLLLALAPLLLVRWAVVAAAGRLPGLALAGLEWAVVAALGALAAAGFVLLSRTQDLLIAPADPAGLAAAVMGARASVWVSFAGTFAAALAAMWLSERFRQGGALALALGLVTVLLLVLLPIAHGTFFADRFVRVLARAPASIEGVSGPIGVVDRSKERVTLFARAQTGEPRLVTVKADALDGIPITAIVPLSEFVSATGAPSGAKPCRPETR